MGLETGTYISDLVQTNPIGGSDSISEGDDHIRLLKKVVKNTFPNIDGAINYTQDEINALPQADEDETISGSWDFTAEPTINSKKFSNVPVTTQSSTEYTFDSDDGGTCVLKASGSYAYFNIESSNHAVGDMIMVYNTSTNSITIECDVTLVKDGEGTVPDVLITRYGRALFHKLTSSLWTVSIVEGI